MQLKLLTECPNILCSLVQYIIGKPGYLAATSGDPNRSPWAALLKLSTVFPRPDPGWQKSPEDEPEERRINRKRPPLVSLITGTRISVDKGSR